MAVWKIGSSLNPCPCLTLPFCRLCVYCSPFADTDIMGVPTGGLHLWKGPPTVRAPLKLILNVRPHTTQLEWHSLLPPLPFVCFPCVLKTHSSFSCSVFFSSHRESNDGLIRKGENTGHHHTKSDTNTSPFTRQAHALFPVIAPPQGSRLVV